MFQPKLDAFTAGQPLLPDTVDIAQSDSSAPFQVPMVAAPAVQQSSAALLDGNLLVGAKSADSSEHEVFDPSGPLRPGMSNITIAQALVCQQLLVKMQDGPTPEESGAILLASTDFHKVKNAHLEAEPARLATVSSDEDAMSARLSWMWHAGVNSSDPDRASRAAEAVDVMIGQVAPRGQLDLSILAEELVLLAASHPSIVAALFTGDLDDVPDLIDVAVGAGTQESDLVETAAWVFVCWAALEQQREACLGWRQIHKRLDEVWGRDTTQSWTIGQVFRPEKERHAFATEMNRLYHDNAERGVDRVEDRRTINRIERSLRKFSLGGINRASENEVISMFGKRRLGSISTLLRDFGGEAEGYVGRYRALMTGPNVKSRAGRRADMLTARIPATQRTAIVCARTCHLGGLAATASTTNDLRAMLDAHLPDVLTPSADKRPRPDKLRLRLLFHVVRIEFLRDGGHLPKELKGVTDAQKVALPLELSEEESRRGHELFDACWAELNDQPSDWRFITPLGWQCHGRSRVRLKGRGREAALPIG